MKLAVLIVALALSLAALIYLQLHTTDNSPPRVEISASQVDKLLREESNLVAVRGTGSMAPYIPAGDPNKIVAWVKVERCEFDELLIGQIVVFDTAKFGLILHRLAQKTAAGFITSGDHNHNYDSSRVYPENFRGRVVKTYVLK